MYPTIQIFESSPLSKHHQTVAVNLARHSKHCLPSHRRRTIGCCSFYTTPRRTVAFEPCGDSSRSPNVLVNWLIYESNISHDVEILPVKTPAIFERAFHRHRPIVGFFVRLAFPNVANDATIETTVNPMNERPSIFDSTNWPCNLLRQGGDCLIKITQHPFKPMSKDHVFKTIRPSYNRFSISMDQSNPSKRTSTGRAFTSWRYQKSQRRCHRNWK